MNLTVLGSLPKFPSCLAAFPAQRCRQPRPMDRNLRGKIPTAGQNLQNFACPVVVKPALRFKSLRHLRLDLDLSAPCRSSTAGFGVSFNLAFAVLGG